MIRRSLLGLSLCLPILAVAARAAECPRPDGQAIPRERFHIYLLLGQSNMAGRGKMTAEDRQPVPGVYMLDAKDRWQPAAHPLHFDKPNIAGVGLGLDFAKAMREHDPDATIGLVPCAVGGTRLAQWSPDGKLYQNAVARANKAADCGTLRGILWHQGEGDSPPELAADYAKRLAKMMSQLRAELGEPKLPIVVGELGHFREKYPSDLLNSQLHEFAANTPAAACATAEGLTHNGDHTHFDADSLKEFGRRYAEQMIKASEGGD